MAAEPMRRYPVAPDHYTLILEHRAMSATTGRYHYADAAGFVHDWGTFRCRALAMHNGQPGFTITCRSEKPEAEGG